LRPTSRGLKALAALALTCALLSLAWDAILAMAALSLAAALSLDALWLLREALRGLEAVVRRGEVRMVAGEVRKLRARLDREPPRGLERLGGASWADAKLEGSELVLRLKPKLKGVYELEGLEGDLEGPLGLWRGRLGVKVRLKVKAYPRVLPFVVEALRLLGAGGYGPGTVPLGRKGLSPEYAGTREYQPGDPLKFIDWKATARLSRLMVKEFHEEAYGPPCVIYDADPLGPITADELAALFLSSVVGLATIGSGLTLMIRSRGELVFSSGGLRPREAVAAALTYVLRDYEEVEGDIYEVVEPWEARRLVAVLKMARAERLAKLVGLASGARGRLPSGVRDWGELLLIRLPIVDARGLIELAAEARREGRAVRLLTPPKPWVDCRDLEEAYQVYLSFRRVLASLRRLNVEVTLSVG